MSELSPAVGLTEIELASGFVGGSCDDGERLPPAEPGRTALEALEAAILPALQRGLCTVSFSGGRDSSIVLAAAVRVARAHGLPLPVPVTMRFGHAPQTEESEWQELVVSHLGLSDWQKLEVGDEVDYVGPYAQRLLLAHGVLYPFNAHSHAPTAEVSRGGTLLTGYGGDDVMMAWRWQHELALLTGRARPRARDLPRLAYFASPLPLRRLVAGRKLWRPAWLTPLGVRMLRQAVAGDAGEPRGFAKRVAWLHRRRYLALGRAVTWAGPLPRRAVSPEVLQRPHAFPGLLYQPSRAAGRPGRTARCRPAL